LLARGADASKTVAPGKTALVIAAQHGYRRFVELLKRESLDRESANMPPETESVTDQVTVLA
jgi:hypothetical protein